jgi:aryl-alcohol dehydrogenase-like predicted oxidoreductase
VFAGRVRNLRLCEVTANEVSAVHAVHLTAVECEWSLLSPDIMRQVRPRAAEFDVP